MEPFFILTYGRFLLLLILFILASPFKLIWTNWFREGPKSKFRVHVQTLTFLEYWVSRNKICLPDLLSFTVFKILWKLCLFVYCIVTMLFSINFYDYRMIFYMKNGCYIFLENNIYSYQTRSKRRKSIN